MKYTLYFLLLFLLHSCKQGDCSNGIQDGGETGIDCGGDCEQLCVNVDSVFTVAPILGSIQGKWFNNLTITRVTFEAGNGSRVTNGSIHYKGCPIEFTRNNPSLSNVTGGEFTADMLGSFDNSNSHCSYPKQTQYMYNFSSMAFVIPSNTQMELYNKDNLHVIQTSESVTKNHYLQRVKQKVSGKINEVWWELEITEQDVTNGSVEFIILEEFHKESKITELLKKGKEFYKGTINGFKGKEPTISIKARATSSSASGFVKYNVRLVWGDQVLSEVQNGYFCLNKSNCNGTELSTTESHLISVDFH